MSGSLPPVDLLRERRLELGLPPEPAPPLNTRRLVWIGAAIGGGLAVLALGAALLLRLQQHLMAQELARLAPVRDQAEQLNQQLAGDTRVIDTARAANDALAAGLVAVRSGSALMTDLVGRTPQALQLTATQVTQEDLELKGRTGDPGAFERINALVLRLRSSPLLDPASVRLVRAIRAEADSGNRAPGPGRRLVEFDVRAAFREPPSWSEQLTLLRQLEAGGMALRLERLRSEGVLR